MPSSPIRVHFAPSPTGYLHVGGARTALFNWLYARKVGGAFLLRIEDTDLQRSTEESARSIFEGLDWLELRSDEPGVFQGDNAEIEDMVLLRSDGHPLYNLSVVLDDIEMRISDVIRGQDHLTNTHKQILLYEAFGAPAPRFAHVPLILAPDRSKLSKRKHGAVASVTTYRDRGFLPAAFRNFLALLGWSPGGDREILTLAEMIESFSLEAISKHPAVFNFNESDPRAWTDKKALWMNAEYLRALPLPELLPLVRAE